MRNSYEGPPSALHREGVWANMKNGLGNLAVRNVDQLAAVVRNRLNRIQYRPSSSAGSSPRPD